MTTSAPITTTLQTRRIGQMIYLRPECMEEYKAIHAAVWPEVLEQIKDSGISDCMYSFPMLSIRPVSSTRTYISTFLDSRVTINRPTHGGLLSHTISRLVTVPYTPRRLNPSHSRLAFALTHRQTNALRNLQIYGLRLRRRHGPHGCKSQGAGVVALDGCHARDGGGGEHGQHGSERMVVGV